MVRTHTTVLNQAIAGFNAAVAAGNRILQTIYAKIISAFVALAAVMALSVPTYAQTVVPLVVPTNEIFVQTNSWMAVFAPVVAIGVGIAVALAILTFIGNQILKAFH